ncbi:hypothetical protein L6R29_10420 [Myxococcota bacterium]|nr:hypothetical protein [Myxococcota bacterium]
MLFERETPKTPFGSAPRNEQHTVHIKGRPGALEILLDEEAPLTSLLRDLQALLSQNQTMIHGVAVRLNFGERPIDRLQLSEIKRLLERFEIRLQRVDLAPSALEDFLEEAFGLPIHIKSQHQIIQAASPLPALSPSFQEESLPPMQTDILDSSTYTPTHAHPHHHEPSRYVRHDASQTSHEHASPSQLPQHPRYSRHPQTTQHPTHPQTTQYPTHPQTTQYPTHPQTTQPPPHARSISSTPTPQGHKHHTPAPTPQGHKHHTPAPTLHAYSPAVASNPTADYPAHRPTATPSHPHSRSAQHPANPTFPHPSEPAHTPQNSPPSRRASLSERLAPKQPAYEPASPNARRDTAPYEEDRDLDGLPDTLMPFASNLTETTHEDNNRNHSLHAEIDTSSSAGRQVHRIMRTCRAGTRLDLEGDVWVFGDVNPGAEIRATGDIIIFGSLRGIAHAGSEGNDNAIIAAFELNPMQLRLGNQIAVSPPADGRNKQRVDTEVAFLNQHHQIEVKNYQGKFPHEVPKPHP